MEKFFPCLDVMLKHLSQAMSNEEVVIRISICEKVHILTSVVDIVFDGDVGVVLLLGVRDGTAMVLVI